MDNKKKSQKKATIPFQALSAITGKRVRIAAAPVSAQALLIVEAIKKYPTLLWIAADAHEMQRLYESVNTLQNEPIKPFLFQPMSEDPAVIAAHLQLAAHLSCDEPTLIITQPSALDQPLPLPSSVATHLQRLEVGDSLDPERLSRWLQAHGFAFGVEVYAQGEAAHRGGILDCWPPGCGHPIRIEFFGNQIESIRYFDDQTQCSIEKLTCVDIPANQLVETSTQTLLELLPENYLIVNPRELTDAIPTLHLGYTFFDPFSSIRRKDPTGNTRGQNTLYENVLCKSPHRL